VTFVCGGLRPGRRIVLSSLAARVVVVCSSSDNGMDSAVVIMNVSSWCPRCNQGRVELRRIATTALSTFLTRTLFAPRCRS
jgi:hypothetical protein